MINLTKGSVSLSKGGLIMVELRWPAETDYDAGLEILYKDGATESIAMFGARGVPPKDRSRNGTVVHHGDIGRVGGEAKEIINIHPDDEILEVAPWAYSAQSNGTGSFYQYGVSMKVISEDETVMVEALNANNDKTVYTLVPAFISFAGDRAQLEYFEGYSAPGSELRPAYQKGGLLGKRKFTMTGPKNDYK